MSVDLGKIEVLGYLEESANAFIEVQVEIDTAEHKLRYVSSETKNVLHEKDISHILDGDTLILKKLWLAITIPDIEEPFEDEDVL